MRFDVTIIGAGLAGCSAAITLAQFGYSVLLLEAGNYPRPKVCGEFLSPESLAFFNGAGFGEKFQALKPARIDSLRITAPNGSEWRSPLPIPAQGLSRFALDNALAEHARCLGVELHENTRVIQIEGNLEAGFSLNAQTVQGIREFQSTAVIAAYGKGSNLNRILKRKEKKQQSAAYLGLKRHFTGPSLAQEIDLHVFQGGYCGISPIEGGVSNVCLLVKQDVFQQVRSNDSNSVNQFIEFICEQNAYLNDWLSQATAVYPDWLSIAQVSLTRQMPVEQDILFAGDAVAMIAPLAGDGMAMALHSGKLAAQAIHAYLNKSLDAFAMKQAYLFAWQKAFRKRLNLGRVLQELMVSPRLLVAGLRVLNRFPGLGHWLIQETRNLALLEELSYDE
jgi:menaquinone-9 beta-reductase